MYDESTSPAPTVPDAAPTRPRPTWLVPLLAAAAGLVVGAGSVGAAWALSGDSEAQPSAAASPSKSSARFMLSGSMLLSHGARPSGSGCAGTGGYSDIAAGTAVTVYDADSKVVGTGELGQGTVVDIVGCRFPVQVVGVPEGTGFYQVEVSHRGKITVSAADAKAGRFAASLG